MHNFCTLFDSRYLTRGIALYESLKRHCPSFRLYIFAFDDLTRQLLTRLALPGVTVIPLEEFEDTELLKVKPTRTHAEYCWTSTSSAILYILERYGAERCTYLDADLCFFGSPQVLLDEMKDASILITEHRYTKRYDKSKKSGKYCVQFICFRNDPRGMEALRWWRERCLEWCYARVEDGKFGDQKYLDDWTTRFPGVHVLEHLGGGVAPWNVQQYVPHEPDGRLRATERSSGREFDVIFYHFHYVRFYTNGLIDLGRRLLSKSVMRIFYRPYLRELELMKKRVRQIDSSFDPHGAVEWRRTWKSPILYLWRRLNGTYNIVSLNEPYD